MKHLLLTALLGCAAVGAAAQSYTVEPDPAAGLYDYIAQVNLYFEGVDRVTVAENMYDVYNGPGTVVQDATGDVVARVGSMPAFNKVVQLQFSKEIFTDGYIEKMGTEPGEDALPGLEPGFYTVTVPEGSLTVTAGGVTETWPEILITYLLGDDIPDAVESLETPQQPEVRYDLSGRRLPEGATVRGIVVGQGKKTLRVR